MKTTALLLTTLLSSAAVADCQKAALAPKPEIPNGQDATIEQMLDARTEVNAYLEARTAYLDCVQPEPFAHNLMVDRMERTAAEFNRERARYLQQQTVVASN